MHVQTAVNTFRKLDTARKYFDPEIVSAKKFSVGIGV